MDYAGLAAGGMPAERLAEIFLENHFDGAEPEYGGRFRESNTLVVGAKFETADYINIPAEFLAA